MARQEHQREDLLRDAKAYTCRAQWVVSFCLEPVFVGFRENASPTFYFGQDEVYHFNSIGQLRRAFTNGQLLKAEDGHLVELTRVRTPAEVQLRRNELSTQQANDVLDRIRHLLTELVAAFASGAAKLEGEVLTDNPHGQSVARLIEDWVAANPDPGIAERPNSC